MKTFLVLITLLASGAVHASPSRFSCLGWGIEQSLDFYAVGLDIVQGSFGEEPFANIQSPINGVNVVKVGSQHAVFIGPEFETVLIMDIMGNVVSRGRCTHGNLKALVAEQ